MNDATAGGFLGGPVTAVTERSKASDYDAVCEFHSSTGSVGRELRIEVITMSNPARDFATYAAHCPADATPLRTIGNEALMCSVGESRHQKSQQVVGRVREHAFIIRITAASSSIRDATLKEKIQQVSEQVAGFLF